MQSQYSQGAATSHHPSYGAAEISGNGGSITSSLRQWRKKDYVEKQQSNDTSTSVAENTSHVARVAPHTYYPPRPANDVCHYQHQYSEYGDPYKPPPVVAPVKYSEIVESQQPPPIENIAPVIPKHKDKEYVDFPPPQPHLKQYQDLPLKPAYSDSLKQSYSDQYMVKESQMPPYMQKQSQMHQYMQKEPYQQFLSKYNMQNQYPLHQPPYPSEPNNFLAHLNKINPRMAQSIINDTHLRETQIPMYHNLEQSRTYQQSQRVYHGPPMNTSPTHSHRNIPPQPYNYSQPYNCSVKQGNDPYNRMQYQHNMPKYLPDYKMNNPIEPNIPNISPQGLYNERLHMNYGPMSPKMSPNYPCNQLEYAQHYQHRRSQIPPEYFSHPSFKPYMENLHMISDDSCPNQRGRKPSLKQYLETWVDEDIAGNLPDIIISNNMNEENVGNKISSGVCVKSGDKQEQPLYVLDTTEIPNENLPHFLHLQQFEKLPDNIRGYYHSTSAVPVANRRVIVENDSAICGTSQIIRNDSTIRTEMPTERIGKEDCIIGSQSNMSINSEISGSILENPVQQTLENKVVQIHIIEEPDLSNSANDIVNTCSVPETVIVKSNMYQHSLLSNTEENSLTKLQGQSVHKATENIQDNIKNMPVIDDGFNADGTSDCVGSGSLTQSDDSSSNQSNSDERLENALVNQDVCGDLSCGISNIYKEMENIQSQSSNNHLHNNIVTSKSCNTNLSEDQIEKPIPIETDNDPLKFDNEINEYLHSPTASIEYAQNSSTFPEVAANLTFEIVTFPNSSDVGNSIEAAVNLSKDMSALLECEKSPKSTITENENLELRNVKNVDTAEEVNLILNSVIDETSKNDPDKEIIEVFKETLMDAVTDLSLVDDNEKGSNEEKQCDNTKMVSTEENAKMLNTDLNTKDLVNESSTITDQSSDDDTSMPDIDKCVEHASETNQPELVENNSIVPSNNIEKTNQSTNENCDNSQCKELNNQADLHKKPDDFEKPPDLTDSKFGAETKKESRHKRKSRRVTDTLEEKSNNINLKDRKSSENSKATNKNLEEISEKVVPETNATIQNCEIQKKAETESMTEEVPFKKHKIGSDKPSKKYKDKEERSHSKYHKVSKSEMRPEKSVIKIKDRNRTKNCKVKEVSNAKERSDTKRGKIKYRERNEESDNSKHHKIKKLTTDSVEKSENGKTTKSEHDLKNDVNKEIAVESKNDESKMFGKSNEKHMKLKDSSTLMNNIDLTNKELPKSSSEYCNSDVLLPTLQENSEPPEEPLTMIKVEQTYLEETENANTNVIYQIADNNVVLQIADELLEINVTTHNGRKVIFVKTLTDAIILSNCNESTFRGLDIEPEEELRYEKICEDVEILLNNNYITETSISKNFNNSDDELSLSLKELCGETDITVLAGEDVCISNEEIVSSSTAELENRLKCNDDPDKKAVKPKKVVTWEDERQQNSDYQGQILKNCSLEEQPNVPLKRPKTKAALKYLETNIPELPLNKEETSIPCITDEQPKKTKVISKTPESKSDKSCVTPKTKSKALDTQNGQNTEDAIKTIEKSTKNKKRKTSLSPPKNVPKKKESLPIKIKKEKIGTHVLKTKIHKSNDKVESPKTTNESTEEDSAIKSVEIEPQDEVMVNADLSTDVLQSEPLEVTKYYEVTTGDFIEETHVSVQENSITSSTSLHEAELSSKSSECKIAQEISDEWEEDSNEIKLPPPVSTKKRLSLEEYNNRKRSHSNIGPVAPQQCDLTNNLLDNINYSCIKNKRELSPESPVLSVNFSNKTYSRNLSCSTKFNSSENLVNDDSLTNSIELQLPKINRLPSKPVYSEEYLQNALRNDLHTVNAFTISLIKENQQLMQRFLNQQRLSLDELKKVKQIIRYKRLIQQLATLKINGLNSSSKQDQFGIRPNIFKSNYQLNVYDLDKGYSSATKVTMEDPLKSFNCGNERQKRKHFKISYPGNESILNTSRKLPAVDDKDCRIAKRPHLDDSLNSSETGEMDVGYSVRQSSSQSQLTLVFKRSFKNDPKMQPYVKLERLFSIDQLAKNRFY